MASSKKNLLQQLADYLQSLGQGQLISPIPQWSGDNMTDPGLLNYMQLNQLNEQAARQNIPSGTYPPLKINQDVANTPSPTPTPQGEVFTSGPATIQYGSNHPQNIVQQVGQAVGGAMSNIGGAVQNLIGEGYYQFTPDQYKPVIDQLVQKYNLPPEARGLLSAQIFHESGFNPNARGYNRDSNGNIISTDRGIAQINDKAHPEISDKQAYDPQFALNWMAQTMGEKYKRLGSWDKALSEYNAGSPNSAAGQRYAQAILQSTPKPTQQPVQPKPTLQTMPQVPRNVQSPIPRPSVPMAPLHARSQPIIPRPMAQLPWGGR